MKTKQEMKSEPKPEPKPEPKEPEPKEPEPKEPEPKEPEPKQANIADTTPLSFPVLPVSYPNVANADAILLPKNKGGRPKGSKTLNRSIPNTTEGILPIASSISSSEKKVDDETAIALVSMLWATLDIFTGRLGMAPTTEEEQRKLSIASVPVLVKYGVPMGAASPEAVLAVCVFNVYAPKWQTRTRVQKVKPFVKEKIEPAPEPKTDDIAWPDKIS